MSIVTTKSLVQGALVERSSFDVGDDAVCVKSGFNWFGRKFGRPARDIVVRDIHVEHGAGPTIGSEMSGSVYNVTFENLTLHGGEQGPLLKSKLGRGGEVAGVTWRNVRAWGLGACGTQRFGTKSCLFQFSSSKSSIS